MPWCPKCKTEYREGMTVCADCGAELVEELDDEAFFITLAFVETEELAQRLVEYLAYEDIYASSSYNEEKHMFEVSVNESDLGDAKVAFKGFYAVESQNELKQKLDSAKEAVASQDAELGEDELEEAATQKVIEELSHKPSTVYVKKTDVSKEMLSTAVTFTVFGAILLIFMLLNATGIIPWFSNLISLILLSVLGFGCIAVGLNSVGRAKKAAAQAVDEEKATNAINTFLNETVTQEFLDGVDDPDSTIELNFLKRIDAIHEAVTNQFGELDEAYLDAIIEEFYDEHFEN